MKRMKGIYSALISTICLVILILDTETAITGAANGIDLCLRSILPSLFPFCLLTKLICSPMLGKRIPIMQYIGTLTGIPQGAESILLLSFIGGYPIGAQCIDDAYQSRTISGRDAARMLAFCNNAGPAFLFGILGCLFPTTLPLWSLYIIHILSAVLVGILLPGKSVDMCSLRPKATLTLSQALESSIKTIASVCGWIIVFRIILQFAERWLFGALGPAGQATVAGLLELSNGCIALSQVKSMGLRYILCSLFLAFGGCCICMQTAAVARHIEYKLYLPGKVLQASLSVFLTLITQHLIFSSNEVYPVIGIGALFLAIGGIFCVIILVKKKKVVAIAK